MSTGMQARPRHWGADNLQFWSWLPCSRKSAALKIAEQVDISSIVLRGSGVDLKSPNVMALLQVSSMKHVNISALASSIANCFNISLSEEPAPCCMYKTLLEKGLLSDLPAKKRVMFTNYVERMNCSFPAMPMNNFWLTQLELDLAYYKGDDGNIDDELAAYQIAMSEWAGAEWFVKRCTGAHRSVYTIDNDLPPHPPDFEMPFGNNVFKQRELRFIPWLPNPFVRELRLVDRKYTEIRTWCFMAHLIEMGSKDTSRFMNALRHATRHLQCVLAYNEQCMKRKIVEEKEEEQRSQCEQEMEGAAVTNDAIGCD